jgi:hypothetical protein
LDPTGKEYWKKRLAQVVTVLQLPAVAPVSRKRQHTPFTLNRSDKDAEGEDGEGEEEPLGHAYFVV